MKKNLFCLAALCAAALVSCTPKELVIDEPKGGEEKTDAAELVHVTINASMDEATKAYIDDTGGFAWKWADGDQLAVFDASNSKIVFTINSSTVGYAVAKFEADGVPSTFVPVKAVFPASAARATPDEFSINSIQSPGSYSIDPEAMVATADGEKVSDTEFNFYFDPAVSYLRFAVAAGVSKVILHTVGKDDTIAGDSRSVTVNLPNTDGGKFWAAVNPAVYHGIRAFAYDGTSYAKKGADAAEIDLSAKGSGKNIGPVSGGTAVSVIENADNLISYLGGTPALDGYIVNDLDLTGKTITTCASFAKIFDGQYHSINNWSSNGVSLFGTLSSDGIVRNVLLDRTCSLSYPATLVGSFGFVVSTNSGEVLNCENRADIICNVTGPTAKEAHAASIIGSTSSGGYISGCINYGNITINLTPSTAATTYLGGVSGKISSAKIENSENRGILTINCLTSNTKNHYIGGVTGSTNASSETNYCKNYGDVVFKTPESAAGLTMAGVTSYTAGTITGCRNEGNIIYESENHIKGTLIGGIAGYCANAIENSFNKGNISVEAVAFNGRNPIGNYAIEVKDNDGNITTQATAKSTVVCLLGGICGGGAPWSATSSKFSASQCDNEGNISLSLSKIQSYSTNPASAARYCVGGVIGDASGPLTSCNNIGGEVSVSFSTGGEDFTSINAGNTCYIGGVVGANYYSLTQNELNMTGCSNSGKVSFHTPDKYVSTNNCIGGVVGWPGLEATTRETKLVNCTNNGSVEIDATVKYRAGGVQGGSGPIENCTNNGQITIDNAGDGSVVGCVVGFLTQKHSITECNAYGSITSVASLEGMGGLIGNIGNYSYSTGNGCKVNCSLSGGPSTKTGLIIGKFNGTKAITFATSENPVMVKGKVGDNVVSDQNYESYITGTSNASAHTINAEYGE